MDHDRPISGERLKRLAQVAKNRQLDVGLVLENVHDPHNIGAVLRSCDSIGIQDVYLIVTDDRISEENLYLSRNTASGAHKWLNVYWYDSVEKCVDVLKSKYRSLVGTHLTSDAEVIHEVDFSQSMALIFGNESDGITPKLLSHLDKNIVIPQVGMVQSLNISVACAVTLYEMFRQRNINGAYGDKDHTKQSTALYEDYLHRHLNREKNKIVKKD